LNPNSAVARVIFVPGIIQELLGAALEYAENIVGPDARELGLLHPLDVFIPVLKGICTFVLHNFFLEAASTALDPMFALG
jgi:hypothetical protein